MVAAKKATAPVLDRAGLKQLVARGYSTTDLAREFVLSRNWTSRILFQRINPRHPGITLWINAATARLLKASA